MKIVFASFFKPGLGGGGGRVAQEMARQFAAEHEVILICPGDQTALHGDPDSRLQILSVESVGEGHVWVPALTQRNVNQVFDLLDRFEPDIVHAHDFISLPLIGQVWAKTHNVPFVHTTHVLASKFASFGAADALKVLNSRLTGTLSRRYLLRFLENCDAIIAPNQFAAEDLVQFGYQGKVFIIPNGRTLEPYRACKMARLSAPEKVLTFIGFASQRKNQLYLVDVLRHLGGEYTLQLVGEPIDAAYQQELEQRIQEYHLSNIVLAGQVPHEQILSLLEKTHIFVSASKMEVQSLAVIEALASGTPVVGLSNETLDELVDNRVGLRLSKDAAPEEMAECVRRICQLSQAEYEELCHAARERVATFDWSHVLRLTTETYQSLLSERPTALNTNHSRMSNFIALVPSREFRRMLRRRVWLSRQASQKARSGPGWSWTDWRRRAAGFSREMWLFVGLTVLVSIGACLLLKPLALFSRLRAFWDRSWQWARKGASGS